MSPIEAFGQRVKGLRTQRHLSMAKLARRAEVNYHTIFRIERGAQGEPSVFTAAKLAKVLGCTIDYLAGLTKHEEKE